MTNDHPSVTLVEPWTKRAVEIDEEIAPLIEATWRLGIPTVMSCQDNFGKVWIMFLFAFAAEDFLNAVASADDDDPKDVESLRNRIAPVYEPVHDSEAFRLERRWRYDVVPTDYGSRGAPDVKLGMSVRFPRSDLAEVTRRIEEQPPKRKWWADSQPA